MEISGMNNRPVPNGTSNTCDSETDSSTFDVTSTDTDHENSTATVTSVTSQSDSQSYTEASIPLINGHYRDLEHKPDSAAIDLNLSKSDTLDISTSASLDKETIQHESSDKNTSKLSFPKLDSVDWYMNPCFQRYWQHYQHCMSWCQKHKTVTKNLSGPSQIPRVQAFPTYWNYPHDSMPSARTIPSYRWPVPYPLGGNQYDMGARHRGRIKSRGKRNTGRGQVTTIPRNSAQNLHSQAHHDTFKEGTEESTGCDGGQQDFSDNDSEVFEMEITEDMMEFFAKSEQHKKERDAGKTDESQGGNRLDLEGANTTQMAPTTAAPKERPGVRRTAEMVTLYGKSAAMIHGMETALQMTYDRNIDIMQPKFWPNMPLRITFS